LKRAILIVLDGCGAGEAPDAGDFNDFDHPSTIKHVWDQAGGIGAPNLIELGFFAACGVGPLPSRSATYGRLREMSRGKDSVTGHWEMMGIITPVPFPTYPNGFPETLVSSLEAETCRKFIGNRPASGTAIITELGPEHVKTGNPILYTSADSVFQIACHESVVPIEELYSLCETARRICVSPNNVQRVIARPFTGDELNGFTRTERRKDYPLEAPTNLLDKIGDVFGIGVVPELFNGRGFRVGARTQSNVEHAKRLWQALESDARFIFANFEDFDMLYGHRNDPAGFANALVPFDSVLGELRKKLQPGDLLILTADHGNDPTSKSTDHSREFVPFVLVGSLDKVGNLGDIDGMNTIAEVVSNHLGI